MLTESLMKRGLALYPTGLVFTAKTLGGTIEWWFDLFSLQNRKLPSAVRKILSDPEYDQKHRYPQGETIRIFIEPSILSIEDVGMRFFVIDERGCISNSFFKNEAVLLFLKEFRNEDFFEIQGIFLKILTDKI